MPILALIQLITIIAMAFTGIAYCNTDDEAVGGLFFFTAIATIVSGLANCFYTLAPVLQ